MLLLAKFDLAVVNVPFSVHMLQLNCRTAASLTGTVELTVKDGFQSCFVDLPILIPLLLSWECVKTSKAVYINSNC